jgi:plastin-1
MNLALNAARGIGCVVTNVNAKDIIDGNQILILGIIWQIIRIQLLASISLTACPELVALLTEEEELEDLLNLQPEALLVRWFNYHLENAGTKRRVHNFGKDLADGECLSILLHHIDPTSCDLCDEADATQRAQHIIMNAKALGVETFIQPADIVKANKKLLMAFVAQIFNTSPSLHVEAADLEEVVANFANLDLDDAGDTREEKVFRMWINSLGIDGGDLYIHNLFHDVQDGVAILKVRKGGRCCAMCAHHHWLAGCLPNPFAPCPNQVMDAIQPGVVTWKRVNIQPKNRYKKVENGNYVIEIAKVCAHVVPPPSLRHLSPVRLIASCRGRSWGSLW